MILVTGATGLVGSHLLLHLTKSETKVSAIYRNSSNIEKTKALFLTYNKIDLFSKINWIEADILDVSALETAFQNIDFVYHCAALISFDPNDEEKLRKTNIEGTANIVNFCIDFNIKKMCYISSTAALGDLMPHETVITEKNEWNPELAHSDYAISKYGAEMEVWRGFQEGLKIVIVNPGVIFGTGFFNEGSGLFFSKIKKGISFYTKGSTGYVSVIDLVLILEKLMNSEISGQRYIIVSENKTYQQVFDKIAVTLNVKKPSIYAKKWLTTLYYKLDWFLNAFFSLDRSFSKQVANSVHAQDLYSNEKIKTALNFEFQLIDDCIEQVAIAFKKV